MRRRVIGTAGHVDHGKTSLVRALTGVETDRLPEEKRRGMSIELGFARLEASPGVEVSIIDVPGHRRFVSTMIAGASGIELFLLVVAADAGVMPQTREHLDICDLLGIRRCVVVLSKIDKVERDLVEIAEAEVRDALAGRFETAFVRCSARTGQGIDELETELRRRLDAPNCVAASAAFLPIDRVFSIHGVGTIITGTLLRGHLAVGEPVWVISEKGAASTTVRGLESHGTRLDEIAAPARVAVNVASLHTDDIARGDLLSDERAVPIADRLDVELRSIAPLRRGAELAFHTGTRRGTATVLSLTQEQQGQSYARLRLRVPAPICGGDRFLLRGATTPSGGATVAGGVVLDALPPRRPASRRLDVLRAISSKNTFDALRGLAAESAPRSFRNETCRFSLPVHEITRAAERMNTDRELVSTALGVMSRTTLLSLVEQARRSIVEHQRSLPHSDGFSRETLFRKIAAHAGEDVASRVLIELGREPGVLIEGNRVFVPGQSPRLDAESNGDAARVQRALREAANHGRTEAFLAEILPMSPSDLGGILNALSRRKRAVRAGDLWFDPAVVENARELVLEHFASGEPFTVLDFKSRSGFARRQTIALLEYFDALGLTHRKGDQRRVATGGARPASPSKPPP